ncbi:MAG: hypothetical protein AAF417_04155 [Pseudomonadota bacterium]
MPRGSSSWTLFALGKLRSRRWLTSILLLVCAGCGPDVGQVAPESMVIDVTGDEFNWYFRYPGPDGELGTEDDRHSVQDLYLPANSNINLNLHSNDYLYSFALPELGLQEIAVPDLNFELEFTTEDERTLQLLGDQFCGFAHETLIGKVYVRESDDGFYDW